MTLFPKRTETILQLALWVLGILGTGILLGALVLLVVFL